MGSEPSRGPSGWTRRETLSLGVGLLVAAAVPLAVLRGRRRLVRRTAAAMGTLVDFAVVHDDPRAAHAAIDAALARLLEVERTMTRFTTTSDVGRANASAARDAVRVSAETALVLEEALRWAESSDGAFDPCLARASAAWDVERRREPLPRSELRRWAGRRLHRALDVDRLGGVPAVRLRDPEAALDLGGIAGGYGVDQAVRVLRERGVERALVNLGGDVHALGTSEDGDPWRVGVRSPDDPSALVGEVALADQAVATSGDYVRGFLHRGRRYHHLLDPATAEPWDGPRHTLTVVADTCLAADAASTALFGLDEARARRVIAARAPSVRIVHSL